MTREAKIGMLTGLGVIVLIGVLLSEYLGGPTAGTPGAQNRMATLPMGASYREKVMQPIAAPGIVQTIAGENKPVGPSTDALVDQANPLPMAVATFNDTADGSLNSPPSAGPVVADAVTPVPAGQVLATTNTDLSQTPVISIGDSQPVSLPAGVKPPAAAVTTKPAVTMQEYVIVPGDTLSKIAKKYYQSSKTEDEQKIVSANPTLLKNLNTMLIVGKKLSIPVTAPAVAVVTPKPPAKTDAKTAVMIRQPGQSDIASIPSHGGPQPLNPASALVKVDPPKTDAPQVDTTKKTAPTLYVVVDGDTLDKIAKKISTSNYQDIAKQIASLNKITDPRNLQIGMKLKLPAKS